MRRNHSGRKSCSVILAILDLKPQAASGTWYLVRGVVSKIT